MTLAAPRVTQQSLQVLLTQAAAPRVTQQSLQVLAGPPAALISGVLKGGARGKLSSTGAAAIVGRLASDASLRSARRTGHVLSDTFKTITTALPAWGVPIADDLHLHSTQAYIYQAAAQVIEALRLHHTQSQLGKHFKTISDQLNLHLAQFLQIPRTITESLRLHDLTIVARTLLVLDKLRLHDSSAGVGHYGLSILEHAIRLHSSAVYFLGGSIAESLRFHDVSSRIYQGLPHVSESLVLSAVLGESFLIRIHLAENLDFTDAQVLKAIYHGTLSDDIQMWAAYVDPGGGFTTWAINTRTNAVTEYQNYVFNSICRLGTSHRFIGADSTGLWLLDGALDDKSDIPTQIKSGWMQLSGSRFTSFKAAYLGLRVSDTGSDFFLKLHAGDGREYVYAIQPQNLRTTKVNMGKGLRARYFAFELTSTGADYDLDSLEFVPITSQRRV